MANSAVARCPAGERRLAAVLLGHCLHILALVRWKPDATAVCEQMTHAEAIIRSVHPIIHAVRLRSLTQVNLGAVTAHR